MSANRKNRAIYSSRRKKARDFGSQDEGKAWMNFVWWTIRPLALNQRCDETGLKHIPQEAAESPAQHVEEIGDEEETKRDKLI